MPKQQAYGIPGNLPRGEGIFIISDSFMNRLKNNFSPLDIAVIIALLYFHSAKPGITKAALTPHIARFVNEDKQKVAQALRHLLALKVIKEIPALDAKNSKSISINHNYKEWIPIKIHAADSPGRAILG